MFHFFFLFSPHLNKHSSLWHGLPGCMMMRLSRPHASGASLTSGAECSVVVLRNFLVICLSLCFINEAWAPLAEKPAFPLASSSNCWHPEFTRGLTRGHRGTWPPTQPKSRYQAYLGVKVVGFGTAYLRVSQWAAKTHLWCWQLVGKELYGDLESGGFLDLGSNEDLHGRRASKDHDNSIRNCTLTTEKGCERKETFDILECLVTLSPES